MEEYTFNRDEEGKRYLRDCSNDLLPKNTVLGNGTSLVCMYNVDDLIASVSVAEGVDSQESYTFYAIDCDRTLLILYHPCKIHFYGCFRAKSVIGEVDINGFILKPEYNPINIYSLKSHSAIYMESVGSRSNQNNFTEECLMEYNVPLMESTKILSNVQHNGSVLLLEKTKLNSPTAYFQRKLHLYKEIRNRSLSTGNGIGIFVDRPGSKIYNKMEFSSRIKSLEIFSRTIVCGGLRVGKSSTLRYLVNKTLNSYNKVLYIDFDLGQPEFTLPESVSAVLVSTPLNGPPYTHLTRPLYSYYLGTNDVSRCVDSYLEAVRSLVTNCKEDPELSNIPWLVNTMGFCKGLGISLTCSVIEAAQPLLLIQLQGVKNENFPSNLTPSYVSSVTNSKIPEYKMIVIECVPQDYRCSVKDLSSNKQNRWSCIEAYFSDCCSIQMILSGNVEIRNSQSQAVIPSENLSHLSPKIVALSSSPSTCTTPSLLGYGLLLRYCPNSQAFIVYTPIDTSLVTTLWVGSLEIPSFINKLLPLEKYGELSYAQISNEMAPMIKKTTKVFRFVPKK